MRDSFIVYTEYMDVLESLTDAQAGLLMRAMVRYARDEEPALDEPVVRAVFLTIKPRMDRDREKWEETCAKRSEAGKQGGRPKSKEKQTKAKKANAFSEKQTKAKKADTDSDSDCEYDNNPPKSPQRGKRESQMGMFDRLITDRAVNHDMETVLREWVAYKNERNERYKEAGMRSLITQAVNHGATHGGAAVCSVIRDSMASGYKGITWDRIGKDPPGRKGKPPERDYDMTELELKLLATN